MDTFMFYCSRPDNLEYKTVWIKHQRVREFYMVNISVSQTVYFALYSNQVHIFIGPGGVAGHCYYYRSLFFLSFFFFSLSPLGIDR